MNPSSRRVWGMQSRRRPPLRNTPVYGASSKPSGEKWYFRESHLPGKSAQGVVGRLVSGICMVPTEDRQRVLSWCSVNRRMGRGVE